MEMTKFPKVLKPSKILFANNLEMYGLVASIRIRKLIY